MARPAGVDARRKRWFRRRNGGLAGIARVDPSTKNLVHRLRPGEIAVISHEDLDQAAAEALAERDPAAVINAHRSMSGRYANAGPIVLARAGIPLIDAVGDDALRRINEGDVLTITDGRVFRREEMVAAGELLNGERLARALAEAEIGMGEELDRFVRNTVAFLEQERDLVLRGEGMPVVRTPIDGRDAVVVVRGNEFRRDLRTIRGYIADTTPVLIAVDGAADALLEEGLRPDIIIGDMDSVSAEALRGGAEVIVHAFPDGTAPGLARVRDLGIEPAVFSAAGTSEDIALLLAFEKGADLIVAVGAHDNLVEFLDKRRAGMASTFVVRLKVGPKLVDAKGVNRLYRQQIRRRDMVTLVGAALIAMLVAGAASPALRLWFRNLVDWVQNLF